MLNFFRDKKGSITVMVILFLVPCIFLNGFLVDLARIKTYGNQALMTADNYGAGVLSCYDDVLKELYGLFAVSGNENGKKAISEIEKYMASSFNPKENIIKKSDASGFMPYRDADVNLSWEPVKLSEGSGRNASLGDSQILATQVGDFMKFRIVQSMLDEDSENILKAIDEIMYAEGNANAMKKRNELNDCAEEAMEAVTAYYKWLDLLDRYPEYIKNINDKFDACNVEYGKILDSQEYKHYKDYVENESDINAAREHERNLDEDESLSAEEEKLIKMGDDYDDDEDAREDKLRKRFEDAKKEFDEAIVTKEFEVNFESYPEFVKEYANKATEKVSENMSKLQSKVSELQEVLNSDKVDEDLKNGIKDELKNLDKLFLNPETNEYSAKTYEELTAKIIANIKTNDDFKDLSEVMQEYFEKNIDGNLKKPFQHTDMPSNTPDISKWFDFTDSKTGGKYNKLWNSLKEFCQDRNSNEEKKASKQKKKAKDMLKDTSKSMDKEDIPTDARNIPASLKIQEKGSMGDEFALNKMIDSAATYFKSNSFSENGKMLLSKFYMIEYDKGMFSSRVTNVKNDNNEESKDGKKETVSIEKSLTGYEMSKKINYLYGAELEYLFGGYNDSQKNLKSARDKILSFRAIVNLTGTYKIKEINHSINVASEAATAINPLLGIAVQGALRLAVAGLETKYDWDELMKGEKVSLVKAKWGDLTALKVGAGKLEELFDFDGKKLEKGNDDKSKGIEMGYEGYLTVMLIFLTTNDDLMQRTSNLITLNVNTVKSKIGEEQELSSLSFKMDDAYTAVKASCTVKLDFAVMPKSFSKQVLSGETNGKLESYEKNSYKFSIIRSY